MSSSINSIRSFEPSFSSSSVCLPLQEKKNPSKSSQNAFLIQVSTHFAKQNFPGAIDALFRFLTFVSKEDSKEDLSKAYEFIFALLEHFTDENLKHFERVSGLDDFLSASKMMGGEQSRLCYELGKMHEKSAKQKVEQKQKSNSDYTLKELINSYDSSLLYYAKTVSILEATGSHAYPGLLEEVFESVSVIFVEIIKCRLSSSFSKAIGKASIEQFQAALNEVEHLKRFCTHKSQIESIYTLAADTITHIQNPQTRGKFTENFVYINDKINEHLSAIQESFSNNIVERYREALKKFRQNFNRDTNDTRLFQHALMEKFKAFFREVFIKDTLAILGPPPCHYAICAMGSIGKEEMCPYSDLEYFILIEEDKPLTKEYFKNFAVILRLQLILLDETPDLKLVFKSLQETNISGFKVDGGGNPASEDRLICTDFQITQVIKVEAILPNSIENTLLKSANLHASDESLFGNYQTSLGNWLNQADKSLLGSSPRRKQVGLALMKERLREGRRFLHSNPLALQKPINVKEHFLEPISHLMRDLSIYFGCSDANSNDIIDFLVDKGVFNKTSGYILKEALSDLYKIRLRLHLNSFCQNEVWDPSIACKDPVGAREQRSLERIYSLAFRPLYLSLEKVLGDLATLETVFHKLDLVKEGFRELYEKGVKSVHASFVKAAVENLIDQGASEAAHIYLYEYLSSLSSTESLKGIYLQVLDNTNFALANKLADIPSLDGFRQSYKRREKALQRAIENLTTVEDTGVQIHWGAQGTKRFIKKEYIEEILDANGDIKDMYSKSMHRVAKIPGQKSLHFKQFPSHPLTEYAIGNLYARIAGFLTPAVELAGFTVRSNGIVKEYPVLISQTIEGQNLKDAVGSRLDALEKQVNWDQWSSMLLCSILSRPGDGRLPNFILDTKNKIWCVDNDFSFAEPVTQEGFFGRKINFCSALFCLFQTKPLSQKALENFCSFDTGVLLNSWLLDVIKKDRECQALFTSEQKKAWLKRENSSKLSVLIREGTTATLNLQFWRLQTYIKSSLEKKQSITPLDLLKQIISLRKDKTLENPAGLFIASVYKHNAQKKASVDQLLTIILGRSAEQSATSFQSDMVCLEKAPTIEEIEERLLFSPEKAREELLVTMISQAISEDLENVYSGSRNKTEVLQGSFKDLSEDRQSIVLPSLGHFVAQSRVKPKVVILHHCDVLDSTTLPFFLHKDLEQLELRFCKKINDLDFKVIARVCPNLKELHVTHCPSVQRVQDIPLLGGPIAFSKLEVLRISSCENLTLLRIEASNLKTLVLRNNPHLSWIDCANIPVHKVSFGWSPKLTRHVLKEFSKKYSVSNCDLMLRGEFSLKKVWSLFFENNNRDFFEEKLEFLIGNGFEFNQREEFTSVIESLVSLPRKDVVQKIVEQYTEIDRFKKNIEDILIKSIKINDLNLIEIVFSKNSRIKISEEEIVACTAASINFNNLFFVRFFLGKCKAPAAKSIICSMIPIAISLQQENIVDFLINRIEGLETDVDWASPSLVKALDVGHLGLINRLTKKIRLIKTEDNQLAVLAAAIKFDREVVLSTILDELIDLDQKNTNANLTRIDFVGVENFEEDSFFAWDIALPIIVKESGRSFSKSEFDNYVKLVKFLWRKERTRGNYYSLEWATLNIALQTSKGPFKHLLVELEARIKNYVTTMRPSLRLQSYRHTFGSSRFFQDLQDVQLKNCIAYSTLTAMTPDIVQFAIRGESEMIERILPSKSNRDKELHLALLYAVIASHEKIIRLLVKKGVRVDRQDADGSTALMFAAANGNLRSVQCLLEFDQNLDISNAQGYTALMLATTNKHLDVIKALVSKGANVDCMDRFGNTPLIASIVCGHVEAANLFLSIRASVTVANARGNTPLIYAAMGTPHIWNELIVRKSNIDHKNAAGNTALMFAAMDGNKDNVVVLLREGASKSLRNLQGYSAFDYANKAGDYGIASILEEDSISSSR